MFSTDYSYEQAWERSPLTGISIAPKHQKPSKMIVLLHGYQGDARSNLNFGRTLFRAMPEAVVVIPNGLAEVPEVGNPHVRQWWNLPPFEGKHYSCMPRYVPKEVQDGLNEIVKEAHVSAGILNKFIKKHLRDYGLSLADCFLVGISQGGITAFEMALFRSELHKDKNETHLGGVAVIGAGIPGPDRLRRKRTGIPPIPVLLARGKHDEIFPPAVDFFSYSVLMENRVPVWRTEVDSGHYGLEHIAAEEVCRFLNAYKNN